MTTLNTMIAEDCATYRKRISELEAENKRLREVVGWYGEQARLARLVHSEGDKGRQSLANDGGERARAVLNEDRQ